MSQDLNIGKDQAQAPILKFKLVVTIERRGRNNAVRRTLVWRKHVVPYFCSTRMTSQMQYEKKFFFFILDWYFGKGMENNSTPEKDEK